MRASIASTATSSRRGIVLDTPDKENAIIRARIDFPLRDDDPDAPALTLANDIFGGGAGPVEPADRAAAAEGRTELRRRHRPQRRFAQPLRQLDLGAIVAPQNAARAEQAIREELERARRDGFTAQGSRGREEGPPAGAPGQPLAGRRAWPAHGSANLDLGRTFAFSKQFEDRLKALTPEQVNAAFRKYVEPGPHDLRDRRRREEGHQVMATRDFRHRHAAARPLGRGRPAGRRLQRALPAVRGRLRHRVLARGRHALSRGLRAARVGPLRPQGDASTTARPRSTTTSSRSAAASPASAGAACSSASRCSAAASRRRRWSRSTSSTCTSTPPRRRRGASTTSCARGSAPSKRVAPDEPSTDAR